MQAYLQHLKALEDAAIQAGYTTSQTITALRKIYYNSSTAPKNYAGSTIGGGTWNILIPNAPTHAPASWATLHIDRQYLATHKEVTLGGKTVDMGHVFCGLDATNHPAEISLAYLIRLKSNKAAVTFVGDLGSVVVEYLHGATGSFYDVARKKNNTELVKFYDGSNGFISASDMAGNADAYAIRMQANETVHAALSRYYLHGGYTNRYRSFSNAIHATQTNTRRDLIDQVFNAALAYAAAKPLYRGDVINVTSDPSMGGRLEIFGFDLGSPTFWEAYMNISGWVVDLFLRRIASTPY